MICVKGREGKEGDGDVKSWSPKERTLIIIYRYLKRDVKSEFGRLAAFSITYGRKVGQIKYWIPGFGMMCEMRDAKMQEQRKEKRLSR